MSNTPDALRRKVLGYFERIDRGDFPEELFTPDFQFYSPKFGIGQGLAMFGEFGSGAIVREIRHPADTMLILVDGDHVAVEGLTEGRTANEIVWKGGETPAGRYASIFHFNGDGLIDRMHIYVDPDFEGSDAAGFRWERGEAQRW